MSGGGPTKQAATAGPLPVRGWICARCLMTSRFAAGHERNGPPPGWDEDGEFAYCLACRRARAAEAGCDDAGPDSTREDRAKLRARALVEFEIRRDPDRPNGLIAKTVRCSVPAVIKARRRLETGVQ
jgi:hypothetical protein